MPKATHIEWTNMTWNPVTGCTKVSQGCKNCYAERMAKRLKAMGSPRYVDGFKVTLHDDLIDLPRSWRVPRLVFVNSMSDLFHENVPVDFIKRVFKTMNECPDHVFQILTKRSARLAEIADQLTWTENIWMGVSVEDDRVVQRIDDLRTVPAFIRFLSCEPLIGSLVNLKLRGIHWVIVGGESGPRSRPMKPEWVHEIHGSCVAQGVAFFFKQWGGVRKDLTGRELNGRTYDEFPTIRAWAPLQFSDSPSPTTMERTDKWRDLPSLPIVSF
ncbi:MAG: phage Gp37/Gp68 family protein [Fimbriimonadaceae bacterium]|nr:phage Gp37/Gp68 family protein [Fimbriimonadaceae bacterium]